MADKRLFISYSHRDTKLVGSVVSLLRATKGSPVFQDVDTIVPGTTWRAEIQRGVEEAETVVVFWCRHARGSEEMRKEWTAGLGAGKPVLPLLLDSTPLPEALAKFQWIDFRAYGAPSHRRAWQSPMVLGLATLCFMGVVSLSLLHTASVAPTEEAARFGMPRPEAATAALPPTDESSFAAPKAAPKPAPKVVPPPPPAEPSMMDEALDNPLALVATALSVVLLGAMVFVFGRIARMPEGLFGRRPIDPLFDEHAKWRVRKSHEKMAQAIVAELSKK